MSKINLANALRESVKHYKQISDLADQLEDLGRVEQTATELNKAVSQSRRLLDESRKEHELVKASIVEARKKTIADAQAEAQRILEQAKAEHTILIDDGRAKAATTKKAAQQHAEAIISEAQELKSQAENMLDSKEAEMQSLQVRYDNTQAELAEADAKLKDIKQQLANFMNGGN